MIQKMMKRLVYLLVGLRESVSSVESKAIEPEIVEAACKEMVVTEEIQELVTTARRRDTLQPTVPS